MSVGHAMGHICVGIGANRLSVEHSWSVMPRAGAPLCDSDEEAEALAEYVYRAQPAGRPGDLGGGAW